MKKKIKIFLLLFLLFPIKTEAYQTDYYMISFNEDNYTISSENTFYKENGDGIDITITDIDSGIVYNEENLNTIVDYTTDYVKNCVNDLKEKYSETVEGEFKFNKVESKGITVFGKDNYVSFHYILNYLIGGVNVRSEFYETNYNGKFYSLMLTSIDSNYLESTETSNIIASFQIINYVNSEKEENNINEENDIKNVIDTSKLNNSTEKIIEQKENAVTENNNKTEAIKTEENKKSSDNYLSSLTVLNNNISFSKDNNDYYINFNDISDITALAEDSKAKVEIKDNNNLNLITIKVIAEDGGERNYYLHKIKEEAENLSYSAIDKNKVITITIITTIIVFIISLMLVAISKYKKHQLFKKL